MYVCKYNTYKNCFITIVCTTVLYKIIKNKSKLEQRLYNII